jgi:hypothetical protein
MPDIFDKFSENLKFYEDGKEYSSLEEYALSFDSKILELENINDTSQILDEMNTISRKMFRYGAMYESQSNVLQKLEEEFSMWYANKYTSLETQKGATEKSKEMLIMVKYAEEYKSYKDRILTEKYRVGLLKRVLSAMESYGYKLQSIFNYRQLAENKGG